MTEEKINTVSIAKEIAIKINDLIMENINEYGDIITKINIYSCITAYMIASCNTMTRNLLNLYSISEDEIEKNEKEAMQYMITKAKEFEDYLKAEIKELPIKNEE